MIHCGDGSDQSSAMCAVWQCPKGMWKCLNNKCIDDRYVCPLKKVIIYKDELTCGDKSDPGGVSAEKLRSQLVRQNLKGPLSCGMYR